MTFHNLVLPSLDFLTLAFSSQLYLPAVGTSDCHDQKLIDAL